MQYCKNKTRWPQQPQERVIASYVSRV